MSQIIQRRKTMLIKKDKNEELEKILAQKEIDEQAKNLLQGILYKVEVSYKDYKKVKAKMQTEEKYVKEIITDIDKKCNKIKVVKLSQKLANEEIQKELEKNKFYVGEEIISYPIEEKILYAIEKKSRHEKILNNKYEEVTIALSDLINTGKNMDRIEVLRDFNGWSWTTINKEIENIEANLIYQMLQILLGEEFLDNWCEDKDGIIDYLEQFVEEMTSKYGEDIAISQKDLLIKIAMANTAEQNPKFAQNIIEKVKKIDEEIASYEDTETRIVELTNHKKQLLQDLSQIERVVGQSSRLKEEYERRNEEAPIDKKMFNIRIFKQQLENRKQQILEQLEQVNYVLNPSNYLVEKNKLLEQKQKLQFAVQKQEQLEMWLIEFIKNFLKCFKILVKDAKDEEEIVKLIYQFRYFMLLPFNQEKSIKNIEILRNSIIDIEKQLVKKAIEKKAITDVPFEIMNHVFETRIIILEDLYFKITGKAEKYYVQLFDENVSEEKFEISSTEKTKINKKIRIFN